MSFAPMSRGAGDGAVRVERSGCVGVTRMLGRRSASSPSEENLGLLQI
jgi:hypothetical protein